MRRVRSESAKFTFRLTYNIRVRTETCTLCIHPRFFSLCVSVSCFLFYSFRKRRVWRSLPLGPIDIFPLPMVYVRKEYSTSMQTRMYGGLYCMLWHLCNIEVEFPFFILWTSSPFVNWVHHGQGFGIRMKMTRDFYVL